jgi:hypothetical protein
VIRPGRSFWIRDPKRRRVFALPFRDRVVQHVLIAVALPRLERWFAPQSYACRSGKGTHRCLRRAIELTRAKRFGLTCVSSFPQSTTPSCGRCSAAPDQDPSPSHRRSGRLPRLRPAPRWRRRARPATQRERPAVPAEEGDRRRSRPSARASRASPHKGRPEGERPRRPRSAAIGRRRARRAFLTLSPRTNPSHPSAHKSL